MIFYLDDRIEIRHGTFWLKVNFLSLDEKESGSKFLKNEFLTIDDFFRCFILISKVKMVTNKTI